MKRCSKCGAMKPLTAFNVDRQNPTGHRADCRVCFRQADRERKARPEARARDAARARARYARDPNKRLKDSIRRTKNYSLKRRDAMRDRLTQLEQEVAHG